MIRLIKYIFITFCFTGTLSGLTQTAEGFNEIIFGDIQRATTPLESLSLSKSGDLFSVQSKSPFLGIFSKNRIKYTFSTVENLALSPAKPTLFKGNGKKTGLINYTYLGNSMLGLSFRSTFSSLSPSFFYHVINPRYNERTNHGTPLYSFNLLYRNTDLSRISMVSSSSREYAAIFYAPLAKKGEFTHIKYVIFQDDFSAPTERDMVYPYASQDYEPLDFYIINKEQQLFISGIYPDFTALSNRNWGGSPPFFQRIDINRIVNGEISVEQIASPGIYFVNMRINDDKDNLAITGFYSTNTKGRIEGNYIAKLDSNGRLLNIVLDKFTTTQQLGINNFKLNHAPNESYSGVESNKFNLIKFQAVDDGFISIAEYSIVERYRGGSDVAGSISAIDNVYYWSGDLVVTKLSQEGKIEWCNVIPKSQRTVNDGGYYLSTAIYVGEEYLHLFFNDHKKNYSDSDLFNNFEKRPKFSSFGSNNVIGHVSIDMRNGNQNRKRLIGKTETKVFLVPQLSVQNKDLNKLIIYGRIDKRHRFGSINFEE